MSFNGTVGHLEGVESPWGNAGGVVKTIEDVERMAHTGVGWIEAGSYTLEPRIGNSPNGEVVYYHNQETGETFNSLGMPNKGLDEVEAEIPEMVRIAHVHNKKLVVNVAPLTPMPMTVVETGEIVARAYSAGADAVLINAGCPNVVMEDGGRHELLSRDPQAMLMILAELGHLGITQVGRVFVRISPMESQQQMQVVMDSVKNSGAVSAVFTPNTWPGHRPTDSNGNDVLEVPGGVGGRSGPAVALDAQNQQALAQHYLQGTGIDVVSSAGIVTASELRTRLDMGAVAAAGTTFFYESQNGWQDDTNRLLADLASS